MPETLWKKCSKCGELWTKLTPAGVCIKCDPYFLTPKPTERKASENDIDKKMGKKEEWDAIEPVGMDWVHN
jgi:hypothetical protein